MKRLVIIALALLVLVAAVIIAAPFFIPASVYKTRIETAAEAALGRDVTIDGDVSLRVFPRIQAVAGATSIANPEGFGDGNFAQMSELRAAVKLLPLFSRRVEIQEFVLVDPVISLIKSSSGTPNWSIATQEQPQTKGPSDGKSADFGASLGDVRLINGRASYEDRQAKISHKLDGLNIKASMDSLDDPLRFSGDGVINELGFDIKATIGRPAVLMDGGETALDLDLSTKLMNASAKGAVTLGDKITFDLSLSGDARDLPALADWIDIEDLPVSPEALGDVELSASLTGTPDDMTFSDLSFKQSSDLLKTGFDGSARLAKDITFDGAISLASQDLRGLAAAAKTELPAGDVYERFVLKGAASGSLDRVALKGATLEFDDLSGQGDLTLDLRRQIPKLAGSLSLGRVDVTSYVVASGGAKSEKQASKPSGWPTEPLDLAPLKAIEADIKVSAEELVYQKFNLGESTINVTIRDGRLVADVTETSLYGGAGSARIVADASKGTPQVGLTANLESLNLKPFLTAAANFGWVDGDGGLQLSLAGEGQSMDAIMKSLTGSGSFDFENGAVAGVDIPKIMALTKAALTSGSIPDALSTSSETDFSNLKAGFQLINGVASTNDLVLSLEDMNVPGKAILDIGGQALSVSLSPISEDKSRGINGFAPPIKVSGKWGDLLKPSLDFDVIQDAAVAAATDAARDELAKKLGEQGLGGVDTSKIFSPGVSDEEKALDLLEGVLGRKKSTPTPTPSATATPTPVATATAPATAATPEPSPSVSPTPTPTPTETRDAGDALEDLAKEELGKALGDLFGSKKKKEEPAQPAE